MKGEGAGGDASGGVRDVAHLVRLVLDGCVHHVEVALLGAEDHHLEAIVHREDQKCERGGVLREDRKG